MAEHAEALGLEQYCVMPGHWRIEGYEAFKTGHNWQIWRFEKLVKTRPSLAACRQWIREQIGSPDE